MNTLGSYPRSRAVADCKSAGHGHRWRNSIPVHPFPPGRRGKSARICNLPVSQAVSAPRPRAGVSFQRRRVMPEIRFECDSEDVAVLDGYCSGTGKDRTKVMRAILKEWSEKKLYEATIVLRVAGRHPTQPESERK